jgi:hypothetical protein
MILISSLSSLCSQSIPDSDFIWKKTKECKSEGICKEIYLKAETDPILTLIDSLHFDEMISKAVNEMNFYADQNGTIKFRIFFFIGGLNCVNETGTKDILIDPSQKKLLNDIIQSITSVEYGKQRSIK